jgi:FkbM family methyltransferase
MGVMIILMHMRQKLKEKCCANERRMYTMKECTWGEIEKKIHGLKISEQELQSANIVLFGASMNGRLAYERLKDRYNIVAFADNNPSLWGGGSPEEVGVIAPTEMTGIENLVVIVAVSGRYYDEIKKQLDGLQVKYFTHAECVFAREFDKLETVYNTLLDDECSKRTYRNVIMGHLEQDNEYRKSVYVRNQYFELPEFNTISPKEVFVDCGAWAGDTVEAFINNRFGQFKRIYAFEPTEKAYKALNYRRDRLLRENALDEEQIVTVKRAVSDENKVIFFQDNVNSSTSGYVLNDNDGNGEEIHAVSLDSYFEEIEDKPTFIKADIEGSEGELVRGAERIISESKPRMALCIYHRPEDLYELPLRIKELNHEYKMAVRHHEPDEHETILYCY